MRPLDGGGRAAAALDRRPADGRGGRGIHQAERPADLVRAPPDLQPDVLVPADRRLPRRLSRPASRPWARQASAAWRRPTSPKYPSRSFTLRNLCSRLERFIREQPALTAPRTALAARDRPLRVGADGGLRRRSAAGRSMRPTRRARRPARLRLGPAALCHAARRCAIPIDAYVIAVKRRDALRSEASNTPDAEAPVHRAVPARPAAAPAPRPLSPSTATTTGFSTSGSIPRHSGSSRRCAAERTLSRAIARGGPRRQAGQVQGLVQVLDGARLVLRRRE